MGERERGGRGCCCWNTAAAALVHPCAHDGIGRVGCWVCVNVVRCNTVNITVSLVQAHILFNSSSRTEPHT